MNSFKALVKREFWESKGSMLYTPAAIAAFFAFVMLVGSLTGDAFINTDHGSFSLFDKLPSAFEELEAVGSEERSKFVQIGLYAPRVFFGFVMFVICLFYCLGSLYDERKDKSILFWKSLPVSDTSTVLSKFVAVVVLTPVLYFAVTAIFQVFLLVFGTVLAWFSGSSGMILWSSSNLFGVLFNGFFSLLVATLWLAPLWAWLMFASAWAKKVAFLWGTLPIFLIAIAEGWIFHSSRFIEMVGERIARGFTVLNSEMHFLVGQDMFDKDYVAHWYEVLADGSFWGGLVVAAVFLAGAIYTRRFQDES